MRVDVRQNRAVVEREIETIAKMLRLYCRGNHSKSGALCSGCETLAKYACERISRCPYNHAGKPVCGLCPTNCFSEEMHGTFSKVMRYAGPRMLLRHPFLTAAHLRDAVRWKMGR